MTKNTVFFCNCALPEHQLVVAYEDYPDFPDKEIFFHVHLDKSGGFWTRLKRAFSYLTGIGESNAVYAEVILTKERTDDLIEALAEARRAVTND